MPAKAKHIIIAGGKTGGHLFPGIAVAQELKNIQPDARILFVGTKAPFEVNTLARYGFDHTAILSRPVKGGSPASKALSAALVIVSLVQAVYIIARFRADFILGVGGFSSFALVLAGRLLFRRTAIQEQNAIPGMTNRLLSKIAHTVFISFEQTRGMPISARTILSGNPMRQTLAPDQPGKTLEEATAAPDKFVILITGGSQGAASINTAVMDAMDMMEKTPDAKDLFIVHQTGQHSETEVAAFYNARDLNALARDFFHDMPAIQHRADLVISRAGAGTLSELAIMGKPAILIPFPHAADDHQTANARNLVDKGAALMVADKDLTGKVLYRMIRDLRKHPEKINTMKNAMKKMAMPHGARIIAGHILGQNESAVQGEN